MFTKNALIASTIVLLSLTSCAHQSKVPPSQGHIDGAGTTPQADQAVSKSDIPKPVKSNVYLPPPKARAKEQTYSVVVNEVPVKEILFALARESKLNVDIHPSIQGRVTLNAVDQTLPAILERLAKQVDLTYKIEGNVLSITPDLPVLRSYKVDYVNMSRDTSGFIGAATEIASTGRAASGGTGTGAAQATQTSSMGTTGANNSSRTQVVSTSKHHFWEMLEQNIKDLLAETDKEVIIGRVEGGKVTRVNGPPVASDQNATDDTASAQSKVILNIDNQIDSQKAEKEYKTLFAATVIVNPEAGIINVRGNSKQHEKVREFLDQVLSSAKRQVLIEATIVEVQLSDTYQAGIDWGRLGNGFIFSQDLGPNIASSVSANAISLSGPGFVTGYSSSNILGSVQLLKQFGDIKVLSSPKLMVLNNQTAVLKVVNNLVYFTVQSQTTQAVNAGTTLAVTTTANTVPVGVVMSVTPQIDDKDQVNINVRPTISRVLSFVNDPNPILTVPSRIPQIQVREMESVLQINSGKTAVLGGLMQDEIQRNSDNVPGLHKIPGLGRLFTGRDDFNRKTELVIFLRPTVIKSASLESDELQSYKQFLPEQQLNRTLEGNSY